MNGPLILLTLVVVIGAMFGFIYVIDRSSKAQQRDGKPSRLIRISAIVIGLVGIGADFWLEWRLPWFVIPLAIILLGYGVLGLFGTVRPRPTDGPQEKMGAPDNVGPVSTKGLAQNTKIIVGCGIVVAVLMCAGAIYFVYTLRDSEVLGIEAKYPETVQAGDSFKLTLVLKNNGDVDIEVQDIDLSPALSGNYDSILAGATVIRTEPAIKSDEFPSLKMWAYHYNRVVKPGETHTVIFYLQAVKVGEFHTDVDVYLSDARSTASDIRISITP
jgi:hypothetical protein